MLRTDGGQYVRGRRSQSPAGGSGLEGWCWGGRFEDVGLWEKECDLPTGEVNLEVIDGRGGRSCHNYRAPQSRHSQGTHVLNVSRYIGGLFEYHQKFIYYTLLSTAC